MRRLKFMLVGLLTIVTVLISISCTKNEGGAMNKNPYNKGLITGDMAKSLNTIKRVDDIGALYEMTCYYDYDENTVATEMAEALEVDYGCSAFSTFNMNDEALTCRNYDYRHNDKNGNPTGINLVVRCNPKNAYKSVAVSDVYWLDFMRQGFESGCLDDGKTDITSLVSVPLCCCDGINEKGLTVSILKLDVKEEEGAPFQKEKGKIFTTYSFLLREMLDTCKDIEEAKKLAASHNIVDFLGFNCHLFVCDASGKSTVIEWKKDKMYATDTNAVTNFYVCSDDGVDYYKNNVLKERCVRLENTEMKYNMGAGHGFHRFTGIISALERYIDRTSSEYKTKMTEEDGLNILRVASQAPGTENTSMTQYSAIYNQNKLSVELYVLRDYSKKYTYKVN